MAELESESDEEYLDDPIKLFDFEEERVHFGSRSLDSYGCQSGETISIEDDTESESDFDYIQDRGLHIKLVDCKKYPSYFKKYSEQIISKTTICNLVSDSDSETDVEHISSDSDCYILKDTIIKPDKPAEPIVKNTSINLLNSNNTLTCKTANEKRQETLKRREDIEIQMALKRRNLKNVDFKRNKGLIGMTISQRPVGPETVAQQPMKLKETKQSRILANNSYINAADKTLSSVGTALIPLVENNNNELTSQSSNDRNIDNPIGKKVLTTKESNEKLIVQFNLGKIRDNLLHLLMAKKNKDVPASEATELNKSKNFNEDTNLDTQLMESGLSVKAGKSSNQIKNVKLTNRYRNMQMKCLKKVVKRFTENQGNDEGDKETVQHHINKDIREPHSPILPCSNLAKKNKILSEILLRGTQNEPEAATNKTDNQKLNKPMITDSCVRSNDNKFQPVCTKKSINVSTRDTVIKNNLLNSNTNEKFAKNNTNCSNIPTTTTDSSHSNIIYSSKNLVPVSKDESNNLQIQIVSVRSMATLPEQVSDSSIDNGVSMPMSTISNDVQKAPINYSTKKSSHNLITQNDFEYQKKYNNTKKVTCSDIVPCHDYTIFRPNQPNSFFHRLQFDQLPFNNRPTFYNNPYLANYIPPNYPKGQSFIPRLPNCIPDYRFLPPYHLNQLPYNPVPFNKTWPPITPKKNSKGTRRPKIAPCGFSSIASQKPKISLSSKSEPAPPLNNISEPKNIPTPKKIARPTYTPQPNNVPRVDIVKDTNKDILILKPPENDKSDVLASNESNRSLESNNTVVATKEKEKETKVLEISINQLKRVASDESNVDKVTEPVEPFKKAKISNNIEINVDNHSEPKKQHLGYSPSILPIPTYEKAISELYKKDEQHNLSFLNRINNEMREGMHGKGVNDKTERVRKDYAKKISLEEYKKRIMGQERKEDPNEKPEGNYCNGKRSQAQVGGNVDRFSTESDLGYDSDSTVIL